ncbi:saccharopine dehydrogenase NADP-binding domain-containing protein [Streptomyces violaceusniger]|uniref:saccharopine dehydrogenase NADP-binding domain-containing protein n=1 Tax=Streptomyces violaceusniger TaxID=68280 RepID=UPI0013875761
MVGIVGGYGAVGRAAARCLAAEGFRLRVGGRSAQAAWSLAHQLGGATQARVVDAMDDQSLRHFSRGCLTVLDCTGGGASTLPRIRRAAMDAGAHFVSTLTDPTVAARPGDRCVVLAAGFSPGLSEMLDELLSARLANDTHFTGYYGGLRVFNHSAALECLRGLALAHGSAPGSGTDPLAGLPRLFPDSSRPIVCHRTVLPGAQTPVSAKDQNAAARWYRAFDGTHVLGALARFTAGGPRRNLESASHELARASALDCAGATPYHLVYGVVEGRTPDGSTVRRDLLIRDIDGSGLVGATAAAAVVKVSAGRVPLGTHHAADVLAARDVITRVRRHLPDSTVRMTRRPASGTATDDSLPARS